MTYGIQDSTEARSFGAREARNTELLLFKGDAEKTYVGLISEYEPCWLHSVFLRKDTKDGKPRDVRTYLPCAKFVVAKEEKGKIIFEKGDEPCPLCEVAAVKSENWRCWWPKVHYAVLFAQLAYLDPKSEKVIQDQDLFIWSFRKAILDSLKDAGKVQPLKTQLKLRCSGEYGSNWNASQWKAAGNKALPFSAEVEAKYALAEEKGWLQAFVRPPSYEDAKKAFDDAFRPSAVASEVRPGEDAASGASPQPSGDESALSSGVAQEDIERVLGKRASS